MAYTYDVTTARGQVRLLSFDTPEAQAIFSDDEIDAFLSLEDDDVYLAAANALDTKAANKAWIMGVTTLMDVQVDGAKLAAQLAARAAELRRQVYEGHGDMTGLIDWAEFAEQPFSMWERLVKQWQRTDGI